MACGCDLNQLSFVGLVGMCDPPRPGVKAAIEELLSGEVDVKMITGDAKETGEAIGKI
jgi:Ca2+-transporting ATPase